VGDCWHRLVKVEQARRIASSHVVGHPLSPEKASSSAIPQNVEKKNKQHCAVLVKGQMLSVAGYAGVVE
jgi:hypothetical protein